MRTRVAAARLALMAVAMVWLAGAGADDHDEARRLMEAGDIRPLQGLVEQAVARYPGRILDADLEHKEGRYVYEIEILDERGTVWELYYDAGSGQLLKTERDR